jgi:hypothetical protein
MYRLATGLGGQKKGREAFANKICPASCTLVHVLPHPWSERPLASGCRLFHLCLSPENDDRTPTPNIQIDCKLLVSRITLSAHDLSTTPFVREPFRRFDLKLYAKFVRQSIIVNSTAWQPRHGGVETSNPVIHVHLRLSPRATTTVLHRFNDN